MSFLHCLHSPQEYDWAPTPTRWPSWINVTLGPTRIALPMISTGGNLVNMLHDTEKGSTYHDPRKEGISDLPIHLIYIIPCQLLQDSSEGRLQCVLTGNIPLIVCRSLPQTPQASILISTSMIISVISC